MDSPPEIGDEAIVVSRLTPSGHVRVAGQLMPAVLRGGHAERGDVVEVVEVRQQAVVVERPQADSSPAAVSRRNATAPPLEFPLSPVERIDWPSYALAVSLVAMLAAALVDKFPWSFRLLLIPIAGLVAGHVCSWLMKGPRGLSLPRTDHRPAAVRTAILLVSVHTCVLAVALALAATPLQVAVAVLGASVVTTLLVLFGVVA